MRTFRYPAIAVVLALAATGVAIAASPGETTKEVAATLSATAQHVNTKTCTGADGTYAVTDAKYTGTVIGTLTGGMTDSLTIHAHSIINQTTGDGIATGHFNIKNGTAPVASGFLNVVVSGSGSLNGLLLGHGPGSPPPPPPPQRLIANFTGTLSSNGISGQVGGNGAMTNTAVTQGGSCPAPPPPHEHPQPHPKHPHIHPLPPVHPPKHH
jgi:hypothetical protein